jgi:hypothetical protein
MISTMLDLTTMTVIATLTRWANITGGMIRVSIISSSGHSPILISRQSETMVGARRYKKCLDVVVDEFSSELWFKLKPSRTKLKV